MKNGLILRGMVASSKVETFKKKDGSDGCSQRVSISDGENTYLYSEFLLGPELGKNLKFGQQVEVQVNYVAMQGRTIQVGGELVTEAEVKKAS
jgi:hypothetical protein